MEQVIYTDLCSPSMETQIFNELNLKVLLRLKEEDWNINDAMLLLTHPGMVLAVINIIDEISIMELSLLSFLCKPTLVTATAINEYPIISRTVDNVDTNCNLADPCCSFISWYKYWRNL